MKNLITIFLILMVFNLYARPIKVMTYNTGTTPSKGKWNAGKGGFSKKLAKISDKFYGNGLSWLPALEAVTDFISNESPDIIGFQEMFDSRRCKDIPNEHHSSFICEKTLDSDPLVIEQVTKFNYQIACHYKDHEKCIAVKKSFGKIIGCNKDICFDGLDGVVMNNCGSRSRIGKARVVTHTGDTLNIIHIHGTSGFKGEDRGCRTKQFKAIFHEFLEEKNNIILGDFNTDPNKLDWIDSSANRLKKLAKEAGFNRVNGNINTPTYSKIVSLDHIYADTFKRVDCRAHGVSLKTNHVLKHAYFDHVPLVCELEMQK